MQWCIAAPCKLSPRWNSRSMDRSMKGVVCHVCSGHYADDGRVFNRACCSLASAGYDVRLFANSVDRREPYVENGVKIYPHRPASSRTSRIINRSKIVRDALRIGADVYHVHEPELLGPIVRGAKGKAVIWDVHEYYLDLVKQRPWIPRLLQAPVSLIWDRYERHLLRGCAAVMPATERIGERYTALHSRVVAVANVPNLERFRHLTSPVRDGKTCVYAGMLHPARGLDQAIEAIGILRQRGIDVPFRLAGRPLTPEYLQHLLKLAEKRGIADLITYCGVLCEADALELENRCSIALVLDLPVGNACWGVSTKMLECMALGLPIVYTDVPSHAEVGDKYSAGISVDATSPRRVADAIATLVSDPQKASRLGANGRTAAMKHFNWAIESEKLIGLYKRLLNDRLQPQVG